MASAASDHNRARVRAVAVAGVALAALLAPVQSLVWNGAEAPGWVATLGGALAPALRGAAAVSAKAEPTPDYFFYGRFVVLVYAALRFVLRRVDLPSPRAATWLARLVTAGACGDFLVYWVSAIAGPGLRHLAFVGIEVPALVAALLVTSAVGIEALRRGPREAGVVLLPAAPVAIVATAALGYAPHGLLLGLAGPLAALAFVRPVATRTAASPAADSRRPRRAAAWCLAGVAGAVLAMLPYRPVIVRGAEPARPPFALPAPVQGLELHVFNTGMNRMSRLLVGPSRPWRPAPAFVVRHPSRGLVVFDCGLSPEVARDGEAALPFPMGWLMESRGREGRTLDAQMVEAGLDPSAVRTVIVSHLHEDHTGAAAAFPAATFLGGAGTGARIPALAPRWREVTAADATRPLAPFDGALDLFGDGSLLLIPGGGHTKEDLMLLLALPGGPVLLAGDAVVHREWLESDDVQRIATDPARAAKVRNEVRALLAAEPALVLLPGHDLDAAPHGRADVVLHHEDWFVAAAWPVEP